MKPRLLFFAAVLTFLLSAQLHAQSGTTYYVNTATGNDNNAGTTWGTAYQTLQKALETSSSGAEIWVAAGTYKPTSGTDRTISFVMKNGVAIYGGFAGTETQLSQRNWATNETILSGDINSAGVNTDNSYRIIFNSGLDNSAVLDGFFVQDAFNPSGFNGNQGGGMRNNSASPVINNCTFRHNYVNNTGGGIYNSNSSPSFTNCIFFENSASFGGAIGSQGGNPIFVNCSIVNNSGTFTSGGIVSESGSNNILKNCIIWGNTAPSANPIENFSGNTTVTYSIVQGGYAGTGNLNADPLFVNAAGGNFRLQACSPAIDAGTNTGAPSTDFDGFGRVDAITGGGTVDIGAYEYQSTLSNGTRWYVNAASAGGNGTSWACAFKDLQQALAVSDSGDEIWVAAGTYKPTSGTNRNISFSMKNGVAIYGGFNGTETVLSQRNWATNLTILSGDIGTIGNNGDNSFRVLFSDGAGSNTILDGFTIRDGFNSSDFNGSQGAGIRINNGSPTILNCIIRNNITGTNGGGIYIDNSSPAITNCLFVENSAGAIGGAAGAEGGSPTYTNCTIVGNTAGSSGGAIFNNSPSTNVIIKNSIIWGNNAPNDNPIYNNQGSSTTVTYSIVQGGWSGTGNLNADPLFVNAASGDLRLQPASPAINAGNNASIPSGITTDLDGNPRIQLGTVDMGAFEAPCLAQGDPTVFGNNQWNVYAYNSGNGTLAGTDWNTNYSGYYTNSALNINTENEWPYLGAPSSAANYQGCPVGTDNHSYSAKRQSFTCGYYRLDVPNHVDAMQLYVNGTKVWEHDGCCDNHTGIWSGWLGANDKIEFRGTAGVGGSLGRLEFVLGPPAYANSTISLGSGPFLINQNTTFQIQSVTDQCGNPYTPATISFYADYANGVEQSLTGPYTFPYYINTVYTQPGNKTVKVFIDNVEAFSQTIQVSYIPTFASATFDVTPTQVDKGEMATATSTNLLDQYNNPYVASNVEFKLYNNGILKESTIFNAGPYNKTYSYTEEGVYEVQAYVDGILRYTKTFTVENKAKALAFDGVNDYVDVPVVVPVSNFTVELWFKSANANGGIFATTTAGDITTGLPHDREIYLQNGNLGVYVYNTITGSTALSTSGTNYADNNWHHVALSIGNGGEKVYVDGMLKLSNLLNRSSFDWSTRSIVGYTWASNNYFQGSIDELRIWSGERTQAQIQNSLNCQLQPALECQLAAYYRFNQGVVNANNSTVTLLADSSGNSKNGSLQQFALTGTSSNWNEGTVSATVCTPIKPGDPTVFGNNQWNVYAFNSGNGTIGGTDWNTNYAGFYTTAPLNFNTENDWGYLLSPSSAANYQGCAVGNDNFSFSAKRQGFTCGYYSLDVPGHDDGAQLWINGNMVWSEDGYNPNTLTNVWSGWLGANDKVELRVTEGSGGAFGKLNFNLNTTITNGDPSVFGTNQWNVYAYNSGNGTIGGTDWNTNYSGYYTNSNLDINTTNDWGSTLSPSSAANYQGCPIGNDNHSFSAKRQGIPCGYYSLNVPGHDDAAQLFINGIKVWEHNSCCDSHTGVWVGWLGANDRVEFRVTEGGGDSYGRLAFTLLNPGVATPSRQSICSGGTFSTIVSSGYPSGTIYNWTRNKTAEVSGMAASGVGDINGSLTNTTNATVTVTFTITASSNGCSGNPVSVTVDVFPDPTVDQPNNQVLCNNESSAAVNFTGSVAGTVFNWINSTPSIGLAASGSGNIASFTAINATNAPVTGYISVFPSPDVDRTSSFTNPTNILIPGGQPGTTSGPSTPYPSNIIVSGLSGTVTKVTVKLSGLTHTFPDDIDILLVGPGGQNAIIMSDVGGSPDVSGISLTLDDAAASPMPDATILSTGTYKPTNIGNNSGDQFNAPAPAPLGGSALSIFNGTSPNGTWSLYTMDDASGDVGNLSGGWEINITTTTGSVCTGSPKTFTITVNPTPDVTQPANQVVCNGASTAAVTFSGAVSGTVYNWTNSNTSIGLAASGSGDLPSFTATNTGNTPLTATITVTPSFSNEGKTCTGPPKIFTITINPAPTTSETTVAICNKYTWNGTEYKVSGDYTWTGSNAAGCDSTATLHLTILSVTSTYVKTDVSCFGNNNGSITISPTYGVSPFTYRIGTTGSYGNSNTFTNLKPGKYRVSILDVNGCAGVSDQVTIVQSSAIGLNLVKTNVTCYLKADGSISATGTGGTHPYQYRFGTAGTFSTTNRWTGLAPGVYSVLVKDANGCIASGNTTITQAATPVSATFTKTDESCPNARNGSITVNASGGTAPYKYRFGTTGGFGTANIFNNLKAGTYRIFVNDAGNCTGYSIGVVIGLTSPTCTIITKAAVADKSEGATVPANLSVQLFPNPTNTQFKLMLPAADKPATVRVLDVNSRAIYTTKTTSRSITFGQEFAPGIYLVEVRQGEMVKTLKAVKIRN